MPLAWPRPFAGRSRGQKGSHHALTSDYSIIDTDPRRIWSVIPLLLDRFEAIENGLRFLDAKIETFMTRPNVEGTLDEYMPPESGSEWLRQFVDGFCTYTSDDQPDDAPSSAGYNCDDSLNGELSQAFPQPPTPLKPSRTPSPPTSRNKELSLQKFVVGAKQYNSLSDIVKKRKMNSVSKRKVVSSPAAPLPTLAAKPIGANSTDDVRKNNADNDDCETRKVLPPMPAQLSSLPLIDARKYVAHGLCILTGIKDRRQTYKQGKPSWWPEGIPFAKPAKVPESIQKEFGDYASAEWHDCLRAIIYTMHRETSQDYRKNVDTELWNQYGKIGFPGSSASESAKSTHLRDSLHPDNEPFPDPPESLGTFLSERLSRALKESWQPLAIVSNETTVPNVKSVTKCRFCKFASSNPSNARRHLRMVHGIGSGAIRKKGNSKTICNPKPVRLILNERLADEQPELDEDLKGEDDKRESNENPYPDSLTEPLSSFDVKIETNADIEGDSGETFDEALATRQMYLY